MTASPSSSYRMVMTVDPEMTPERYREALDEYLKAERSERAAGGGRSTR